MTRLHAAAAAAAVVGALGSLGLALGQILAGVDAHWWAAFLVFATLGWFALAAALTVAGAALHAAACARDAAEEAMATADDALVTVNANEQRMDTAEARVRMFGNAVIRHGQSRDAHGLAAIRRSLAHLDARADADRKADELRDRVNAQP